MDNNLLKQLISQHKRVVIPDFGAFLKKETPGGEGLVFSPFLRKDDGVMTDAIVREYGVETEDARAMMSEFVIYLRQSLASSGRYHIEGVGMLAVDANGTVTLREGEPEPMPVVPEPIVTQPVQPVVSQQVFAQPQRQIQRPATPVPQPTMTRPQSIQVQPPMPQVPPPMGQPIAPQQQAQPMMPRQSFGQQQPMMPQQPQQVPQQRPYPFQQGGMPQQAPQQSQPMAQPQQPQQQQQRPVPQQPQQQVQPPQRMGRPMPHPSHQQPMPQPQQQMMPGQQAMPPMPQPVGAQQQGGMPPRGPHDPGRRPSAGQGGNRSGGNGGNGGNGGGRPVRRNTPPKTKADVWLIVAIVAALVVIAIMVYGFLNADTAAEIDLGTIAPVADTVATQLPEGM